jgi:hypothetical protein
VAQFAGLDRAQATSLLALRLGGTTSGAHLWQLAAIEAGREVLAWKSPPILATVLASLAVTTDLTATPEEIIARYAARWSIEVTFFDVKNILGVGQARNRTTKAVQRTVPFGLFCHSILIVGARTGRGRSGTPPRIRWGCASRVPSGCNAT